VRARRRALWERLVPHWRLVLIAAAALAVALWFAFERTAS
jgi:hypothetical protein